jgi:hypothetical protein
MRTISASPIKQMALAKFAHEGVSMTDVVRPVARDVFSRAASDNWLALGHGDRVKMITMYPS